MQLNEHHLITSLDQLAQQYGQPHKRAVLKQKDRLDEQSRAFIAAAPFVLLSTAGASGVDCSPRGDQPGFVTVVDDKMLLMPDRRGNNRVDSLKILWRIMRLACYFSCPA